ncbi:MAG: hypothetical protein ACTSWN_15855 [Promethearchaeota archaeon]
MQEILEEIVKYDNEGRKIISDANEKARKMIEDAKIQAKMNIGKVKTRNVEISKELEREYEEKIKLLKKEQEKTLEKEIQKIKSVVSKNWNHAVEIGLDLIEKLD